MAVDWSTSHRQYPPPDRPWSLFMRWINLLFMHWPVPPDLLEPLVPRGMRLDRFDGRAWIGVVPFTMTRTRARFTPRVPGLSTFPELNVRTYVTVEDRPGVLFFSLDAASSLAVWGARRFFYLPYFRAQMQVHTAGGSVHYSSRRVHPGAPPAALRMRYRPIGDAYTSRPGDVEHFLTARFCLYTADAGGRVRRCEIHHGPWPLQAAEAEVEVNTMTRPLGLTPDGRPLLHYARRIDVVSWTLEQAESPHE